MESGIKSLRTTSKETKDVNKIPSDATIIRKESTITVREIENGFVVSKNFDISYKLKGSDHNEYMYYTKEWFSPTNPVEIKSKDKQLADLFE